MLDPATGPSGASGGILARPFKVKGCLIQEILAVEGFLVNHQMRIGWRWPGRVSACPRSTRLEIRRNSSIPGMLA